MNKKNYFDKAVLLLSVIIAFYVGLILFSDFSSISELNIDFQLIYLPIIILMMVSYTFISSFKFYRLLQQLDKPIPYTKSISIYLAGLSLALTPGGIGTAIKSKLLKQYFGYSISSTFPVIVLERWTELIAVAITVGVLLLWSNFLESQIVFVLGIFFIISFSILISKSKTFFIIKKIILKIKFFQKFYNSFDESEESFKILMKKKNLLEIILLSLPTKIIQLFTVYFVFLLVGLDFDFFNLGQIYYTSLLIGNLSFLPAGIIVTETGMIAMLVNYGTNFTIATLGVILLRLLTTWALTITGTLTYYLKFKNFNNKFTNNTSNESYK